MHLRNNFVRGEGVVTSCGISLKVYFGCADVRGGKSATFVGGSSSVGVCGH